MRILQIFLLIFSINLCFANRYDELLFSDSYIDVQKGLKLGADIESRFRGSTPLYNAAHKYNIDVLNLLLKNGADVNALSHGESALHKVVQLNNYQFAQALLKAGADVNIRDYAKGNTPLHYAIASKNTNMILLIMSYGGDMYVKNNLGITPARQILTNINVPPFNGANRDINLTASSFHIGLHGISLVVTNLTNRVIKVTYGTFYMNEEPISEKGFSKKIPPFGSANIGVLPLPRDVYKNIIIKRNGIAKINYGFEIEYEIDGVVESFYKALKADVKLW